MNEVITLVNREYGRDDNKREVFCEVRSVGQKEFYAAHGTEFRPELKLILADYLDYEGETLIEYDGQCYCVLRSYRSGQELELTVERAPKEDCRSNV